jgi:hypothetical protein
MEAERERREMTWYMAREIVRLSDTLDKQAEMLARLADRVAARDALPPTAAVADTASSSDAPMASHGESGGTNAEAADADTDATVAELHAALDAERDMVERLRRSKLELERRVVDAETALSGRSRTAQRSGVRLRAIGLVGKLFGRGNDA